MAESSIMRRSAFSKTPMLMAPTKSHRRSESRSDRISSSASLTCSTLMTVLGGGKTLGYFNRSSVGSSQFMLTK